MNKEKEPFVLKPNRMSHREVYFVTLNGDTVGYIGVKNNTVIAEYNDEIVYDAMTWGVSSFDSDERNEHIGKALSIIRAKIEGTEESWIIEDE